ncbi:aldehyde dehydrogenase [Streptomyces sp. NBC_00457]|uniref:aldehyde dehydrogenase n=1 Tax=unclassified Streptomyces TaxID=2593676 RepID=UPI002E21DA2C|nr:MULTISPECIES: aldehyde dehydrogenase [unclassified Streptomyces]
MSRTAVPLPVRDLTQIHADGTWKTATGTETVTLLDPASEEPLGSTVLAGAADVNTAVTSARRALDHGPWERSTPAERADVLERFADALERHADDMSRLVTREMGMPLGFSRMNNVDAPAMVLRYYAGLSRGLEQEETRVPVGPGSRTVVRREPIGVVAVIPPWNYPVFLAITKIAPALAAGCTVVFKPSVETSLSGALLVRIAQEAGVPAGVFCFVPGGVATGAELVRHPGIDKVAFTGATSTGRLIGAECGERLIPANLELGGKSAAIVLDDADLEHTLQGLGFLSFLNTGQTCFAMTRVVATPGHYDRIVDGLAEIARQQVIGDPLAPATTTGPLASARQRETVEQYVASGLAEGARLVTGGRRPDTPAKGWFYEPAVFAEVGNGMRIAREEIFGPVVCVLRAADEDEAVAIANDSPYGLAGTVWTADPEHGLDIGRRVRTGTFGVNGYPPDISAPWGGMKDSGGGREYGPEGLESYRVVKSLYI